MKNKKHWLSHHQKLSFARTLLVSGAALSAVVAPVGGVLAQVPAQTPMAASAAPELYSPESDAMFQQPYIDVDEWRETPVRHRYVHGGFKGTDLRFSYYFPEKDEYQRRFFQYVTPVPDSETSSQAVQGPESLISSSIDAGAYFVETNGGGASATAGPGKAADRTIGAYRANAAAAEYSRQVAAQMYGEHRPYGYIFGGSGGSFRTFGSVENTQVWDGSVPFVIGTPMAIPNNFSVRMHAMRILQDKFPQIVDALEPGGSGDPYAGLNQEEREALLEVTRMGFPPESWFGWETMGVHAFTALYPGMLAADPSYFEDFWTKPGYLGHDAPESLKKARLQFRTSIAAPLSAEQAEARGIDAGGIPGTARGSADLAWQALVGAGGSGRPVAFQLTGNPPEVGFLGGDLIVLSGQTRGQRIPIREIEGDTVLIGVADLKTLAQLNPGDEVQIDNSNFLAAQTYHRHQLPPAGTFPVYDQFRGPDSQPLYPQRPMLLGPIFAAGASGTVPSGDFNGKMIIVQSAWDREAFPWHADWYRKQAQENLGAATDENLRVWFTDRALHGGAEDPARVVSYIPVLQQALRDVSAWVEKKIAPPASTNYRIVDGQVALPAAASEREGIQPTVSLRANGGERATVRAGQPVRFTADIAVPPGTGEIVAANWDFEGKGTFPTAAELPAGSNEKVTLSTTHAFTRPGTYFPILQVKSQRSGNADTPYALIPNLGRVRVVVE